MTVPSRPRPIRSIKSLVNKLDGPRLLAQALGVQMRTVQRWVARGEVSPEHESRVLALARRRGLHWQPPDLLEPKPVCRLCGRPQSLGAD